MHPTSRQNIHLSQESYHQCRYGIVWCYEAMFGFVEKLVVKYGEIAN